MDLNDCMKGERLDVVLVRTLLIVCGHERMRLVEESWGTMYLRRPDRFRWEYTAPFPQEIVSDGERVWIYDADLEQVTVKPQADALANTPALLLGGSDTALEQFEYQGTTVEDEVTWVRLVPVSTESGFVRVELAFVEDQLRRMVFFDSLDQTTYVTLENVSVNEPVDAGRFVFTVPEDVDLVGKPAVAAPADE